MSQSSRKRKRPVVGVDHVTVYGKSCINGGSKSSFLSLKPPDDIIILETDTCGFNVKTEHYTSNSQPNVEAFMLKAKPHMDYVSIRRHGAQASAGMFYGNWSAGMMRRIQDKLGLEFPEVQKLKLAILATRLPLDVPINPVHLRKRPASKRLPSAAISELLNSVILNGPKRCSSRDHAERHAADPGTPTDSSKIDIRSHCRPDLANKNQSGCPARDYKFEVIHYNSDQTACCSNTNWHRIKESCSSEADSGADVENSPSETGKLSEAVPPTKAIPNLLLDSNEGCQKTKQTHTELPNSSTDSSDLAECEDGTSAAIGDSSASDALRENISCVSNEQIGIVTSAKSREHFPSFTDAAVELSDPYLEVVFAKVNGSFLEVSSSPATSSVNVEESCMSISPLSSISETVEIQAEPDTTSNIDRFNSPRPSEVESLELNLAVSENDIETSFSDEIVEQPEIRSLPEAKETLSSDSMTNDGVLEFIEIYNGMAEAERDQLVAVLEKISDQNKIPVDKVTTLSSLQSYSVIEHLTNHVWIFRFTMYETTYEGRGLSANTAILNGLGKVFQSSLDTLRKFAKENVFAKLDVARRVSAYSGSESRLSQLWKDLNDSFCLHAQPDQYSADSMPDPASYVYYIISESIKYAMNAPCLSICGLVCCDVGFIDEKKCVKMASRTSQCGAILALLVSLFDVHDVAKLFDDLSLLISVPNPFGCDVATDLADVRQALITLLAEELVVKFHISEHIPSSLR